MLNGFAYSVRNIFKCKAQYAMGYVGGFAHFDGNVTMSAGVPMNDASTFDEVLDAVEMLPVDQQAELVEVVRRRLAERGRQQIIADTREAQAELKAGKIHPSSVDDLMREIES